jgi:hypothetical protein
LLPSVGHRRYLRRHPWRWIKSRAVAAIETIYVFVQLMRLVPEPALRREYRRRLWNVLKRRPHISVLRGYCAKCALHFHYNRLIGRMRANHAALGSPTYELPPTMRSDAPASLSRDTEPAAAE